MEFIWCQHREQRVPTIICSGCTNRKCLTNKTKFEKLCLKRDKDITLMYIGKTTKDSLVKLGIVDFKNPTKDELQDIVEVYVVHAVYKPQMKISLEQVKETQPDGGTPEVKVRRKRKNTKGSEG